MSTSRNPKKLSIFILSVALYFYFYSPHGISCPRHHKYNAFESNPTIFLTKFPFSASSHH